MDEILEQGQSAPAVAEGQGDVGVNPAAENTEVAAAAPETSDAGQAEPVLSIDENGELNISDAALGEVLGEVEPVANEPISDEPKAPEVYTPEDMAKAFIENTIEVDKLPPAMQDYYKAVIAEQQRRAEILSITKPQQPALPQQPIALPVPPQQKAPTPQEYAELQTASKTLASRMLGIPEADFDEFNPNHQQAQSTAMQDIRAKVREIEQTRYQQQLAQYNQYQQQARVQNLQTIVGEFQKNPNWQDIDKNFYPAWRSRLDPRTANTVDAIMVEGNVEKVRALMGQVVKAYESQKSPVKAVAKPPAVMSSTTSTDVVEHKGNADASKLASMSPEERSQWFMQNKFV